MARRRRRSSRQEAIPEAEKLVIGNQDHQFTSRKSLEYVNRLLEKYPITDEKLFKVIVWAWGSKINEFMRNLPRIIGPISSNYEEDEDMPLDISGALAQKFMKMGGRRSKSGIIEICRLNRIRMNKLSRMRLCGIERCILSAKKAFSLTDMESELCCFTLLNASNDELKDLFLGTLECQKLGKRHYLAAALGMRETDLRKALSGTLATIGLIEINQYEMDIDSEFLSIMMGDPNPAAFTKKFFTPVTSSEIPLSAHFLDQGETTHVGRLLSQRPKTSTHILLYGDPGSGKTSFACRLVKEIGIPSYQIVRGEENKSKERRAAIVAGLNMTNHDEGSILIVDEADNVLNTRHSWLSRGETQDKGWLNDLLEKTGVRMIWITNSIEDIEPSVLRRFAHSIQFKSFGTKQRLEIWETVSRKNRVRKVLGKEDLENLAREFKVSAGAIEIAVRKAVENGKPEKEELLNTLKLSLRRHETLVNSGVDRIHKDRIEENYSIEGLNIVGDLPSILDDLGAFDSYLRGGENDQRINMNLLFYGPPGTGKSELARYVSRKLDRELICKKASDLLNPYVGMTEKFICEAFRESEREDAVLVIDEVDTMLFNRDRAQRSWEISQTNEFLTQMERFRGILICTTNRFKDLDSASVRRFNHKLEFNFLAPEGNILFYERMLRHLADPSLNKSNSEELMNLEGLSPGDFKIVRDRFSFRKRDQLNHAILISALREELLSRSAHSKQRKVGF